MNNPFPGAGPDDGLAPNLIPHPPGQVPEAPGPGDAVKSLHPFLEPQTPEDIIERLVLDRPLKLFIPNKQLYPQYEFRIINSIASEIADAHNKGWREVTDPELVKLFTDQVAGTDKDGKAYRPILCARPKKVGEHIRRKHRVALASLYAGMDPRNKEINSQYAELVDDKKETYGKFRGQGWSIRV